MNENIPCTTKIFVKNQSFNHYFKSAMPSREEVITTVIASIDDDNNEIMTVAEQGILSSSSSLSSSSENQNIEMVVKDNRFGDNKPDMSKSMMPTPSTPNTKDQNQNVNVAVLSPSSCTSSSAKRMGRDQKRSLSNTTPRKRKSNGNTASGKKVEIEKGESTLPSSNKKVKKTGKPSNQLSIGSFFTKLKSKNNSSSGNKAKAEADRGSEESVLITPSKSSTNKALDSEKQVKNKKKQKKASIPQPLSPLSSSSRSQSKKSILEQPDRDRNQKQQRVTSKSKKKSALSPQKKGTNTNTKISSPASSKESRNEIATPTSTTITKTKTTNTATTEKKSPASNSKRGGLNNLNFITTTTKKRNCGIQDDDQLMKIVLGTHDDTDDEDQDGRSGNGGNIGDINIDNDSFSVSERSSGSRANSVTSKNSMKRRAMVHLPDLITRNLPKNHSIGGCALIPSGEPEQKSTCSQNPTKQVKQSPKPNVKANAGKVTSVSTMKTVMATKTKTKHVTKKVKTPKDPLKPKSFRTAYVFYSSSVRPRVKEENPDLKPGEISKLIGELFRKLTDDERTKWDELAIEDKARFQKEMEEYSAQKKLEASEDDGVKESKRVDVVVVEESPEAKDCNEVQKQSGKDLLHENRTITPTASPEIDVESKLSTKEDTCAEAKVDETNDQTEPNERVEEIGPNTTSHNAIVTSEEDEKGQNSVTQRSDGDENMTKNDNDDDDVTICFDDESDRSVDEEGEEEADHESVIYDDEGYLPKDLLEANDTKQEIMIEKSEMPSQNVQEIPTVDPVADVNVNILQPRKKVKPVFVHTLQPRKKVKVNELQPRKKIKINELQPRKKVKTELREGKIEESTKQVAPHINELQPRKKIKVNTPRSKPMATEVTGSNPSSDSFKNAAEPHKEEKGKESKEVVGTEVVIFEAKGLNEGVEKEVKINKLEPRKKGTNKKSNMEVAKSTINEAMSNAGKNQTDEKQSDGSTDKKSLESVPIALSEEDKEKLAKYQTLRSLYFDKAKELVDRVVKGSIEEEDCQTNHTSIDCSDTNSVEVTEEKSVSIEFDDSWLKDLAMIIQGSSLPVNELACLAKRKISENLQPNTAISQDTIAAKIKIIASRNQYLVPVSESKNSGSNQPKVDIFTDTSASNMWRWELVSLEMLPDGKKSSVKRARAVRRRLKNYQKALLKLVQSIDDYDATLHSAMKTEDIKHRKIAKISADEERVLKYEREEEKARLQREAKIQKDKERIQKLIEKEAEKDRKKEEVIKKQREKAEQEAEKEMKKEQATKKQKARMMSFFKSTCTKEKTDSSTCPRPEEKINLLSIPKASSPLLDSEAFWKSLNSGCAKRELFPNLSRQAKKSRWRKTQKVDIRVFSSVVPDNPFDQQPFDEERTISVWNKNKYLSFHEDYRPPYRGTWSKHSDIISGKNPFGKDTTYLNYDVDSEAEWEEEDNEQGIDCSVEGNDDDDDEDIEGGEDTTKYDYGDGWIAEDGDLTLEDDDEETMAMRKKRSEGLGAPDNGLRPNDQVVKACVIAPLMGGLPQFNDEMECPKLAPELVEGIHIDEAQRLFSLHEGEVLLPSAEFCLEDFPPLKKSEKKVPESKSQPDSATKKKSPQEMTDDDIRTFAKFIHNCTLKSKDLIVEEFRLKHGDIINRTSRTEANRKLDLIANKRRLKNGGGVIWEVKKSTLESLQLQDLIKETETTVVVTAEKSDNKKKRKKKKKKGTIPSDEKVESPVLVTPQEKSPSKKRKQPGVSKASANLLASFLSKKRKVE